MKRYKPNSQMIRGMLEEPDGAYVTYSDYLRLIIALEYELNAKNPHREDGSCLCAGCGRWATERQDGEGADHAEGCPDAEAVRKWKDVKGRIRAVLSTFKDAQP